MAIPILRLRKHSLLHGTRTQLPCTNSPQLPIKELEQTRAAHQNVNSCAYAKAHRVWIDSFGLRFIVLGQGLRFRH